MLTNKPFYRIMLAMLLGLPCCLHQLAFAAPSLLPYTRDEIPDHRRMTIKGTVRSGKHGLEGVVVSDGVEVTKTDRHGIYYLASQKKHGFVFISVPGNYEVDTDGSMPVFFKRLEKPAGIMEEKDFELKPVNNDRHVVLAMADMHLAGLSDDVAQFRSGFIRDANRLIDSCRATGVRVYGLTLGDMTWDGYWYKNGFGLPQYLAEISSLHCPVFHVMGNHDNDPYIADDFGAAATYRRLIGPTYYSFNLGKVHYVVLDDTEYLNNGGATGTVGKRNYKAAIGSEQLAWLRKDLAALPDSTTPVVVALHIPLHRTPALEDRPEKENGYRLEDASALLDALQRHNVHLLSGHIHINYTVNAGPDKLMEHNTAAICATWWKTGSTGFPGNHICKDGSPGGYGVWEANGQDLQWYYKAVGFGREYQFRAYDLNTVAITPAVHTPKADAPHRALLSRYAGPYSTPAETNEVLINVWGYDPAWKVEVYEDGISLPVKQVEATDPLHIISYTAPLLNTNSKPKEEFSSIHTTHMFRVSASSPTSTLRIRVTDRFGSVYTEDMARPKAFHYAMN